jgi:hypothetical protein
MFHWKNKILAFIKGSSIKKVSLKYLIREEETRNAGIELVQAKD